jgi:hypothetical protein
MSAARRGANPFVEGCSLRLQLVYDSAHMTDETCRADEAPIDLRHVISVAIDDVALASLRNQSAEPLSCNLCDDPIEGDRAPSSGLLMWTRGDEIRFDEPPLCLVCSSIVGVAAFQRFMLGDGDA